ncbi:MAG: hypothetical protein KQJ78_11175 [Deltaproteobacteria bacterium]|nr:hypothetical protein [Deltaproteobacteria bacterium]
MSAQKHPPRPGRRSRPVIDRAAELLAEALEKDGVLALAGRGRVPGDLAEALINSFDGYGMVKYLEHFCCGWEGNAALVSFLDDQAFYYLDKAHQEAIGDWVRAYDIKPELPVGSAVLAVTRAGSEAGVIVGVDESLAQYQIELVSEAAKNLWYRYTIFNFEDVSPALGQKEE